MSAPHALAAFNWGVLRYDWDDPRIAEFQNNLGRVNALARRSDGFIWQLPEDEMEFAQNDPGGVLGAVPRFASTLSVWRDVDALHRFVFDTIHGRFVAKSENWFAPQGLRLVLWHVPLGHKPSIAEAKARAEHLRAHGASGHAFDWAYCQKPGIETGQNEPGGET